MLEVFVKVLNELQGYYAKLPYVAQFEAAFDTRDDLLVDLVLRPEGH